MAKYRVIKGFYDLEDREGQSYHLYDKGDEYPRDGLNPSPERIAFLMSDSTRFLEPVIEEVVEEAVEETVVEVEKPKRRRTGSAK